MYKYFVVDSWLPEDECTFEYLSENRFCGWGSYDEANDELKDKIMEYGFEREDLKIVRVLEI